MRRQIIALGGGGFSMELDNPRLDDYILAQSPKQQPSICFLGTASGDAVGYIDKFYTYFQQKNCVPSHLSLFKGHTDQIEAFLLKQDILYVGGGNTRNMLVLWKEWGIDKMIRKAYANDTILSGLSAGAICWFEEGLTDSVPNQLNRLECLGLLKGSNCPHFDGETERQHAYREQIKTGAMKSGYACNDGVGLHFINEQLATVISSRPNAYAYRYQLQGQVLSEEKVEPLRL